ncbi:Predicted polyphosphate-or ATP-dependent NAD kinase [Alteromonadaceae bacterium Bs31]|nr:Predicted polyphosphate-or ATP-dependent NAD kinase [Alteromonadaceae bacterium Bs31]
MNTLRTTEIAGASVRVGFLVNPLAGVGGPSAYKGSDGESIQLKAIEGEIPLRAPARAKQFLVELLTFLPKGSVPSFVTCAGAMGAEYLNAANIPCDISDLAVRQPSKAEDTKRQVQDLQKKGIDILLFVGGDGTARDICSVIDPTLPVLGIPSGVKMHSGVFAVTPKAAASVTARLILGELTALAEQEVRDIDEDAFRRNIVKSRYYGDMFVPLENTYVQHVKQGGMEVEELVLLDMAAELRERIEQHCSPLLVIFGPGSTVQAVQEELSCETTLLGVDVYVFDSLKPTLKKLDVNSEDLEQIVSCWKHEIRLIITAIGGQGHIIGRGNQQLLPQTLRAIGKQNIWLLATKRKLQNLQGRPLLVDSSDACLDAEWEGLIPVICGYRDSLIYPLGLDAEKNHLHFCNTVVDQCKVKLTGNKSEDSRRLFHGRGRLWPGLDWCCVDYFLPCLLLTFFKAPPEGFEPILTDGLWKLCRDSEKLQGILIQRRYDTGAPIECVKGQMPENWLAQRGELSFVLSHKQQNVGYFLDMEPARCWLERKAAGKKVLNLFSYTCAFSVVAASAGAESVVNIDMSKGALSVGRENHRLNQQANTAVSYLSHNIFKSWGKLKREGPYDVIIIDPPSYQKGSFVASKDYQKVLRKLSALLSREGFFLACLNAPEITCEEFQALIAEHCGEFSFVERLHNSPDFPDVDEQRSLKMLVYKNA